MDLKLMNRRTESLLETWVEPFTALAWLTGYAHPGRYVDLLWELVLKNQAHDGLAGCHVDNIEVVIRSRYDEAIELAGMMLKDSIAYVASRIPEPDRANSLLVLNPLPWRRSGYVAATLNVPAQGWALIRNLEQASVSIEGIGGRIVQGEVLSVRPSHLKVDHWNEVPPKPPTFVRSMEVTVGFQAEEMPAMGYRVYRLSASNSSSPKTSSGDLENEFLKVVVAADGTMDLVDKVVGRVYKGLGSFHRTLDRGDLYSYCPDQPATTWTTRGTSCVSRSTETSGRIHRVTVRHQMTVPEGLRPGHESSPVHEVVIPIEVTYALRPGSCWVEVSIAVENTARDGRLQVCFPTGILAGEVLSGGHFGVIGRPVVAGTAGGAQTHHHSGFCAIEQGGAGLAILDRGLPEHSTVEEHGQTTLATVSFSMLTP